MKRRILTAFLFVMVLSSVFFGSGTANAQVSGGYSYWFYDGSGCCSKLYFYPGGGQDAIFTGLYMDMLGDVFYYVK